MRRAKRPNFARTETRERLLSPLSFLRGRAKPTEFKYAASVRVCELAADNI
jgi:hypothetical protein